MADKKISALADAGVFSDTDLFAVVQGASTLKMTGAQLRAAFFQNPMTAAGDLIIGGASGAPARLGKGADGKILGVVGGILTWVDPPTSGGEPGDGLVNPMTAEGEMIIGGTGGAAIKLLAGANGKYLQMVSNRPAWVTLTILSNPMTAAGDMIIGGTDGAPSRLAQGTDGQVLTLVSGVPVWAASNGATLSKVVTNSTTGYEMTTSDDNNSYFIMTSNNAPTFNFYRDQVSIDSGKPAWPDGAEVTVRQGGDSPIEFGAAPSTVTFIVPAGKQLLTSKKGAVVRWKKTGVDTWSASGDLADAGVTNSNTSLTLAPVNNGTSIRFTASSAVTITLQDNTFQRWKPGMEFEFIQDGAGSVTLSVGSGITVNNNPGATRSTSFKGGRMKLKCISATSNIWDLTGDLSVAPAPAPGIAVAAARTLALSDAGAYLKVSNATAVNITVPPQSSVAWATDTEISIEQSGAGAVTLVAGAGVTLNKLATSTLTTVGQFGVVTIKRTAADTWTVFGALGATP